MDCLHLESDPEKVVQAFSIWAYTFVGWDLILYFYIQETMKSILQISNQNEATQTNQVLLTLTVKWCGLNLCSEQNPQNMQCSPCA